MGNTSTVSCSLQHNEHGAKMRDDMYRHIQAIVMVFENVRTINIHNLLL